MKAAERFWSRVDRNGPIPTHWPELGPCWLWTGQTRKGYSILDGRVAHYFLVMPLPGLTFVHLCRVRNCVNPDHLDPVTIQENIRRGIVFRKGGELSLDKCYRGHLLEPGYRNSQGTCKQCFMEWYTRHNPRRKGRTANRSP